MRKLVSTLFLAIALAACGGGGGGSTPPPPPAPPPAPPPPPADPSEALTITTANGPTALAIGINFVESMLELGLLALNRTVSFVGADDLSLQLPCTTAGNLVATNADGDNSGGISAGDVLTVDFQPGCAERVLLSLVSGELTITVDEAFVGKNDDFIVAGSFTFGADFAVEVTDPASGIAIVVPVAGTALFEAALGGGPLQAMNLRLPAGGAITVTVGSNLDTPLVERITAFDMTRRMYQDLATFVRMVTLDAEISIESETLEGAIDCRTESSLGGPYLEPPAMGRFRCDGADGSAARLISDRASGNDPVTAEIDLDGDGTFTALALAELADWDNLAEGPLFNEEIAPVATLQVTPAQPVAPGVADIPVNDVVYNPVHDKLYVSNDEGIHELDPVTLVVQRSLALTDKPRALALTDDGATLWYGQSEQTGVGRVDIATLQSGVGFELGVSPPPENLRRLGQWLDVVPGTTDVLIVTSLSSRELLLYNAGQLAPQTLSGEATKVVFRDVTTMIGVNDQTSSFEAYLIDVNPDQGLTITEQYYGLAGGFNAELHLGSTDVYNDKGHVFNIDDATQLGVLDSALLPQFGKVLLDTNAGRIYGIGRLDREIRIFDETTRSRIGRFGFEEAGVSGTPRAAALTPDSLIIGYFDGLLRFDRAELEPNLAPVVCGFTDVSDLIYEGEYKRVNCPLTTVTYDAIRNVYYGGLSGAAGPNGNAVVVIDADDYSITDNVSVGAMPTKLVVSDDGNTLHAVLQYTSTVAEIDLPTRTLRNVVPLGFQLINGNVQNYPYQAITVAQSPADTSNLVVNARGGDMLVYRDNVQTGNIAMQSREYRQLLFNPLDPVIAYASRESDFDTFSADGTGVTLLSSVPDDFRGNYVVRAGSVFYNSIGQSFDAASGAFGQACDFELAPSVDQLVAVSAAGDKLHFLDGTYHHCDPASGTVSEQISIPRFGNYFAGPGEVLEALPGDRLLLMYAGRAFIVAEP